MRQDADPTRRDTNRTMAGPRERPDETATGQHDQSGRRYTVHEAALLLGLSVDAVRKRAERGRLKKEKAADGTVYIILDAPRESSQDQPATGQGTRRGIADDQEATRHDALVSSLQDQINHLRRELEVRNDELRRKDHLLAAALERLPELEAPSEEGSYETRPEGTYTPRDASETQTTRQRSWLVRFFFGP